MKITYETHFKSNREDGRFVSSLAGFMEKLRNTKPLLEFDENINAENFEEWRSRVKEKYRELLCMPEFSNQPKPVKLSSAKRDGYTVEKWELYPDEYLAVPFLVLIPDGASRENKVPGVMCLPGSVFSKEYLAGEELLEPPNCRFEKFPERNKMALCMVKNGMAAFAFDNVGIAECGLVNSEEHKDYFNSHSRVQMVHGYLQAGLCYPGMATFILMNFLMHLDCFDFVDREKFAVSGHSLGTEAAMSLGLLSDDVKAVVFNDLLCDNRIRYVSETDSEEGRMTLDAGNWHVIPGLMKYFCYPDLCSAIAPKPIAFNEGGAEEYIDKVRRAYKCVGAEDNLQITHYPKYAEENSRKKGKVPRYGLDSDESFKWMNCDPSDHSFRQEPSVRFLRKCFNME